MTVTSRSAGDLLTAAIFNTKLESPILTAELDAGAVTTAKIADGNITVAKLAAKPCAHVTHNAAQSIANSTQTALAFNTERYDTDTIHDTATNNSRLTCVTAGKYRIWGFAEFASNATGDRALAIRLNGATYIASSMTRAAAGNGTRPHIAVTYALAATDYVELMAFQDSGGALNVNQAGNYTPEFGMEYVSA